MLASSEALQSQASARPCFGEGLTRAQQPLGTTCVDQGVGAGRDGRQRNGADGALVEDLDAIAVLRELVDERHAAGIATAVQQAPVLTCGFDGLDHREDRGDADPAGHEDVLAGCVEREVVAWAAHGDVVAGMKVVVDPYRAAATGRLAEHGDPVGVSVERVPAQRVLPDSDVADMNVDVRAGVPVRKLRAVWVDEHDRSDPVRLLGHLLNQDGELGLRLIVPGHPSSPSRVHQRFCGARRR